MVCTRVTDLYCLVSSEIYLPCRNEPVIAFWWLSNVRKVGWINSWAGLLFGLTDLSLLGKFANIPTFDIVGPGYIVARSFYLSNDSPRDRVGHGRSQWEPTLQCNVFSHWLSSYPEWPLLPINKSMFVDFIYNHKLWWDIVCLLSC